MYALHSFELEATRYRQEAIEELRNKARNRKQRKRVFTHKKKIVSMESYTTKNLAKNYGKAICNFIIRKLSNEYLIPIAIARAVDIQEFKIFVKANKNSVNNIEKFRNFLTISDRDEEKVKIFKKMFRDLALIFIKYFAVNWIFSGRLEHRQTYLRFRFKMMRRIRNPEKFTFIMMKNGEKNAKENGCSPWAIAAFR